MQQWSDCKRSGAIYQWAMKRNAYFWPRKRIAFAAFFSYLNAGDEVIKHPGPQIHAIPFIGHPVHFLYSIKKHCGHGCFIYFTVSLKTVSILTALKRIVCHASNDWHHIFAYKHFSKYYFHWLQNFRVKVMRQRWYWAFCANTFTHIVHHLSIRHIRRHRIVYDFILF